MSSISLSSLLTPPPFHLVSPSTPSETPPGWCIPTRLPSNHPLTTLTFAIYLFVWFISALQFFFGILSTYSTEKTKEEKQKGNKESQETNRTKKKKTTTQGVHRGLAASSGPAHRGADAFSPFCIIINFVNLPFLSFHALARAHCRLNVVCTIRRRERGAQQRGPRGGKSSLQADETSTMGHNSHQQHQGIPETGLHHEPFSPAFRFEG